MKAYSLLLWQLVFVLPCLAKIPAPAKARATQPDKVLAVGADTITIQTSTTSGYKVTHIDSDGTSTIEAPKNVATFRVLPTTEVTVDGLPSKLGDVQVGMKVMVTSAVTPTDAETIVACTIPPPATAPPPVVRHGKGAKPAAGGGVASYKSAFRKISRARVLSVQADRITIGEYGTSKATAYQITTFTAITVNGKTATVADIQPGMIVHVTADGQYAAGSIDAADGD